MKLSKELVNEIDENKVRIISDSELQKLKELLIEIYKDLFDVCRKYDLNVMVGGGSCLGAIRHKGFIPWDDDFDVNMPRDDYEKFKEIFDKELGDKYILDAPNYSQKSTNRFPKLCRKGTSFVEWGMDENEENTMIKIDIFVMENVPNSKFIRCIKGMYCNLLMLIASCVWDRENVKLVDRKELESKSYYFKFRSCLSWLCSYRSAQKWLNMVDRLVRYKKETKYVGFPTGRKHYFGEIHLRDTILPLVEKDFENIKVYVPKDYDLYLTTLYGDYMTLPPIEKREKHYITKISFEEE